MRRRVGARVAPLASFALAAGAFVSAAQGPEPAPSTATAPASTSAPSTAVSGAPAPEDPRWLVVARELELEELVGAAATALSLPIDFNPTDLAGKVSVRLPTGATGDELWEIASQALASRNLTSIQSPGSSVLTIVPLDKALPLARLEEDSVRATRAGFVKVLVPLAHERVQSVSDAVKLVLSKSGSVAAFQDSRSLVVADLRPNVLQALRLVQSLDTSFDDLTVDEIALEHSSPTAIVALLDKLGNARKLVFGEKARGTLLAHPEGKSVLLVAPKDEKPVWWDLIHQFDQAEPLRTIHYSPRRFGLSETARLVEEVVRGSQAPDSADPWRMVIDELTGSLILTTTEGQHERVNELLNRIETVAPEARRPLRSFPVRNRGVEELKGLLEGLLDAGALREALKPEEKTPAVPQAQGVTSPLTNQAAVVRATSSDKLGRDVILTADKATNRLIAMGEGRVLDELGRLITELDVRTPQVLVEALVVTLTEGQTRSLGVELQHLGAENDAVVKLGSLFGLGSPDPASSTLPAASGTGFSGVVLSPGDFSAAVRALQTVNEGRTLTIPKVLVNNNQAALLNSVLQTPFASTNASTTVATTSFGGTQDAGTTIQVTPQIADGDQLVLDYTVSLSAFVGTSADPTLPPPRQENKLKSIVTVPDGYAVVVGGLEIGKESKARSSVPVLGDIPILGWFFGNRSADESRSRFFVFLRCSVQRSQTFEDLRYLGEKDLKAAGIEDGWPRLEPRWIR